MENTAARTYEAKVIEILGHIASDSSEVARGLRAEGERLITVFRSWHATPPTQDARIGAMTELFKLNRQYLEHVETAKTPDS